MRRAQKRQAEELVRQMEEAHDQIKKFIEQGSIPSAKELLEECQNGGVTLGTLIENTEGEGHPTVLLLEEYCELIYQVHEDLAKDQKEINTKKIYKLLRQKLIKISNGIKNDVRIKIEVAFFPYKASMWDSLESVYLAAKEDSDCDAYCVPIPYYDLNPDHSFGKMHYEGGEYPEEIEVVDWQTYNFEERKPDVIYIHNPYDNCNLVTSVHPRFYSSNLKKYTDTLVYIPYYSTSGGMSEAQSLCPAYIYADYIVIQSPKFRKYFDANIDDRKFLPFGSPKFDRVIKKCQNPPDPPKEWKERMVGKKVYFYNTSISGMLADTENFLKKMDYVFRCFERREDTCLLWRPHPLLEATFDSMRPQYREVYDALKQMFLDKNIGILDTTPDIAIAIAFSDAYIGDAGTSVTSLFGVVGKPLFILSNQIHEEPKTDGWRYDPNIRFSFCEDSQFAIRQGDKLYVSEKGECEYQYLCDLTEHTRYNHYSLIYEINNKYYVCPDNAQNILIVGKHGVEKIIKLDEKVEGLRAFSWAWKYGKYIILLPLNYPAIVRYDTATGQIKYFDKDINVFIKFKNGQNITGSSLIYQGELYIASPTDNQIYKLNVESGEVQIIKLSIKSRCGCYQMAEYRDELWLMPYEGRIIVRWNPMTGETREYSDFPSSFMCVNSAYGCEGPAFNLPAFDGDNMYLAPGWSNMYLKLDINTGKFTVWNPSFENDERETITNEKSSFLYRQLGGARESYKLYSYTKRKLYYIDNIETAEFKEAELKFDVEELQKHEPGFCECEESLKYACIENYFNSLNTFLNEKVVGNQFDRDRQLAAYRTIVSNLDGNCGQKTHEFIKEQG